MKEMAEKVVYKHIPYIIIKINYHWTIQYCISVHLQKPHICDYDLRRPKLSVLAVYCGHKKTQKKKNLFKHIYEYI